MSWERLAPRFGQGQTRGLKHREAESKAMCSSKGCLPSGGQTEQKWGQHTQIGPPFCGRAGLSLCGRVPLLIERGVTLSPLPTQFPWSTLHTSLSPRAGKRAGKRMKLDECQGSGSWPSLRPIRTTQIKMSHERRTPIWACLKEALSPGTQEGLLFWKRK